jgi:hypothetical protein
MGNRQNLPHSQLTENKPKNKTEHLQKKVISHFYRKKFARPVCDFDKLISASKRTEKW